MKATEKTFFEEITGTLDEIIKEVRKLIREGNARSLVIKNKNGKELFKTQLTVGVAGTAIFTVIAPVISAITMFVLFANDVSVFVEKEKTGDEANMDDEYEVDAEVIEIENGDDEAEEDGDKADKTVGKKKKK